MEHRFVARLYGVDAASPAYIEVPRSIMRSLRWGSYVRIVARLNDKHELRATIMNVGWGPSFLVPRHVREKAGLTLNDRVSISIRGH